MNKYLLMSAAAAMVTIVGSGVAQAATTVHLDDYCDYFVINTTNGNLVAAQHVGAWQCGSSALNDPGLYQKKEAVPGYLGKKAKSGAVVFGDNSLISFYPIADGLLFVLGTPYGSSSEWAILANTAGGSTFVWGEGQEDLRLRAGPNNHKSALAEAIKALGK
ncbi:MAG TPA: hypothetical protein VHY79_13480 [Rhizomicrobium sp.]|jgi:hypothetical protein|nr:hypothetical protein [Rhizomicrobium sp.]